MTPPLALRPEGFVVFNGICGERLAISLGARQALLRIADLNPVASERMDRRGEQRCG